MKIIDSLQNNLTQAYPEIHRTRLSTLMTFVRSGIKEQRVSVTYLGRDLKSLSKTSKKHDIKRADRLCGNHYLHNERLNYYSLMTRQLVGAQQHPIILVDWSPIDGSEIFQVLRASIPMGGRALTLYEKVHPESALNTNKAHQQFLDDLAECLPQGCQPIIISDAIFRVPWFKAVEKHGWYWLGRVRGNVLLSNDKEIWQRCQHWFTKATGKAKHLGEIFYSKSTAFSCQGFTYKGKAKGRHKSKKRGGASRCTTDKYQQQKAKEPWLLVGHLPERLKQKPEQVIKLYKTRMQIEENFRDTKNARLGLSLEYARSRSPKRYDNLLLIASLILLMLWCIGYAAYQQDYRKQLQANTLTKRNVLSVIYVGREVVDDRRYVIDDKILIDVIKKLPKLVIQLDDLV
jgi:hypothetical protein